MNTRLFYRLCLMLVIGLTTIACSNDESEPINDNPASVCPDSLGMYHYQLDLNCSVPDYDEGATTRSWVYTWDNAATLIVRFKSGSKFIDGLATYSSSDNLWTIGTYETLPVITGEGTCEVYYFYGASGLKDTNVTMNENTACYYTTTATYRHPSETSISVNASLGRKTWRLRFKGTYGTTITLPGTDNDVKYYSAFNGQTGNFTNSQKDVKLTVKSDGYTPYIYGTFVNNYGDNKITVYNGTGYERKLTSSNLAVGESAYLTIPTESSHEGWTPIGPDPDPYRKDLINDPNLYVKPNLFMVLSGGWGGNWTVGSNTSYCYNITMSKADADSASDLDIFYRLVATSPTENIQNYVSWNDKLSPNTDYYVITLAYNSAGKHTAIYKHPFRTASNLNQPLAKISDLKATTIGGVEKWTLNITLSNATNYYLIDDTRFEDEDDYFYAFCCYKWITEKQVTSTYNFTGGVNWNRGSDTQTTVLTWALTSSGELSGEVSIARASVSSNVPVLNKTKAHDVESICISKHKRMPDTDMIHPITRIVWK